ncbi:MAG: hypothetical protein LBE79_09770 [Tannerella sp.]|jgi:tetratricopeptide (TPR) repeat protein|nr:hypothetical protein [Tannerella sp.]
MEDILQRYLDMENSGNRIYFDADEIVELLDYFEDMEDFDHYEKLIQIGQKLHPHNTDIQIRICKAHIYNKHFKKALAVIEQIGEMGDPEFILLKCECLYALDRSHEIAYYIENQHYIPDEALQELYEKLIYNLHERYEGKNIDHLIEHALSLFPDSLPLKEELCYHLEIQGNLEQAIDVCKELIDKESSCIDYWYILGRLYAITGSFDKAIEAFEFALICDDTDLEIKILIAFCFFLQENFEKVAETYLDVFSDEKEFINKLLRHSLTNSNDMEFSYILLKNMIEKLDDLGLDSSLRFFLEHLEDDEDEVNGLLTVADCFPGSLLFLLFNELIFMSEGEHDAISNIEQLIQLIYQKGADNENFRLDANSKFCISPKRKIEKLLDKLPSYFENHEGNFLTVRKILNSLLDGDINKFCQLFAQSSLEEITSYLEKLFPAGKRPPKQPKAYLRSHEICRSKTHYVPSSELSANYLINKNQHN